MMHSADSIRHLWRMVRGEGHPSNQALGILESWNDFLKKNTIRFKGPTP